jgi:hypothetical protein
MRGVLFQAQRRLRLDRLRRDKARSLPTSRMAGGATCRFRSGALDKRAGPSSMRTRTRGTNPAAATQLWNGDRYRHDRIRVAYLSADFCNHATANLMAELFESHDAARFDILALSFGPSDDSEMRKRLERAIPRFIDVQGFSDEAAAQFLREQEIDIAVDEMHDLLPAGDFRPSGVSGSGYYLGFPRRWASTYRLHRRRPA